MSMDVLSVTSEIGKLRRVLLHRPGKELENLTPETLDRLLFDDIPYLKIAREEHDAFAKVLRNRDVEVVYLEDLVTETIEDKEVREKLLEDYLTEAKIYDQPLKGIMKEFFSDYEGKDLVMKLMEGVRKKEIESMPRRTLNNYVSTEYPFIIDPMPNLYFTRDPFATIGSGVALHRMKTETRNRETIFGRYIFTHHPEYKKAQIPLWYESTQKTSIEGGDILILNKEIIAIGISQRTQASSIEKLAERILKSDDSFTTILAFNIPKSRAFMHLDTVFTMIDHDTFTIHYEIQDPMTIYSIQLGKDNKLKIVEEELQLDDILKKYLNLSKVNLIKCAGGDKIDARREQWNDGSNTLAIAPGEVVVYSRNYVTNRILEENGVKVHTIPSSELSRGRGGPRCMSMPLIRDKI